MTPENIWGIQQLNSCQKQYEPADDDITTVVHIHKPSPLATFISHWSILRSFCFKIKSVKSQSYLHATSTRKKELSTKCKTLVLVRRVDNNSLIFQSDLCSSGHLSVCLSIDQSEQKERKMPLCLEREGLIPSARRGSWGRGKKLTPAMTSSSWAVYGYQQQQDSRNEWATENKLDIV